MGFMLIEIGLLQRMSIFLGHPVYSLSVLLSTLILIDRPRQFLVGEIAACTARRGWSLGALQPATYAVLAAVFSGPLFAAFSAAELGTRIALCVAFIAPAGILLGFGFPTGMRLVSAIDPKPTPWFWGINGAPACSRRSSP